MTGTARQPIPTPENPNENPIQNHATDGSAAPLSAASVSARFEPTRTHRPVSLRTVAIVLLVSIVITLVMTATVLGLQLLAESYRS